jgi:hypothetical protein
MTLTKLDWHQEQDARSTGPIAVVRDCIDEDSGATYWASLPKDMTLNEVIDERSMTVPARARSRSMPTCNRGSRAASR